MSDVVETVTADTLAELRAARDRAIGADLVELRLDGVRDVDVAGALADRARPVIVTCRPIWEGGRFDGSEEERLRLVSEAVRLGAEYVDVEWRADHQQIPRSDRTRVVLSHHDFAGVPIDLEQRVRAMRATGHAVIKIAVNATRLRDCLTLKRAVVGPGAHVAIAMGPAGRLTRVWPAWMGSCWTYGGAAAPGQVSTRDLIDVFRVRRTTASSAGYAIAGSPLCHSASPAMHNTAFDALGLDAVFVPLETDDAAEFVEVAGALNLAGASVTAPLKEALLAVTGGTDALSAETGAVNTLRRGERGWEGRNFDVAGFLAPLEQRSVTLRETRAVVLGAGGAARAVVWALRSQGARVAVSARRPEQARALARELRVEATVWPPEPGWTVLINATPVGTWPHADESPLDAQALTPGAGKIVYDLVYNPLETPLLRAARQAGAEGIGGLEMLVSQACRQCDWWTGRRAPRAAMEAAARAFVIGLVRGS